MRGLQPQERAAGREAAALPRPGLRSRGESTHPPGRADAHRKGYEYCRASNLYPRPRPVLGVRQLPDRTERPGRTPAPFPRSDHGTRTKASRIDWPQVDPVTGEDRVWWRNCGVFRAMHGTIISVNVNARPAESDERIGGADIRPGFGMMIDKLDCGCGKPPSQAIPIMTA